MDSVLDIVTRVMIWLGDLAFGLLALFSPTLGLWIISALTGVLMLFVWRYTSNQDAIADVRAKISANLLATRLFKDNLSVTFRAQRQILWQALRLMGHSLKPMLVMMAPFVLVMVQIGIRFEHRPVPVGERAVITVTLRNKADVLTAGAAIHLPAGLRHDRIDPCRAEAIRTVDWRITAASPGTYTLEIGSGDDTIRVPVTFGDDFDRVCAVVGGSFWNRLLFSTEPAIPASSNFESVRVHYPPRSTPVFGLDIHWLITLMLLSIVFALLFKPFMKVHI